MKATTKSLGSLLKMTGVEGPEEEGPPEERDEEEGPKTHAAVQEFFEAGKSGDWEGAHKALHSIYKAYEAEDGPEGDEEEAGEDGEEEEADEGD
jgi:hypothetical protein